MANSLKIIGVIALLMGLFTVLDRTQLVQPMHMSFAAANTAPAIMKNDGVDRESTVNDIKRKIVFLGGPDKDAREIGDAVVTASYATGVEADLITALMYTESRFDKRAVSPPPSRGHHGLMQISQPIFDAHANTIIGAKILNEQLKSSNNDVIAALCRYKGWSAGKASEGGVSQARAVMSVYNKLKRRGKHAN